MYSLVVESGFFENILLATCMEDPMESVLSIKALGWCLSLIIPIRYFVRLPATFKGVAFLNFHRVSAQKPNLIFLT